MHWSCPSEEELRAFSVGNLPTSMLERIAGHVQECGECDRALSALDSCSDGLMTQLQALPAEVTAATEQVPEAVLQSARTARYGSHSEFTVDAGRRYARQLEDGPCRLGRFELESRLGDGSFGYVFRARDVELDRTVAVKIQRAGSFASEEDVERFLREARSAARLQHSGIVSVFDSGQTDDGVCFLVSEYIAGDTLEARMRSTDCTPVEAARIIAELADPLQYAHEHDVIHRDIKPSNIIIDEHGHPHITDFGLAKRTASDDLTMTSDGRVMGTPAYMSPEQARGDSHHVDARTDVYSLGVILYELLTRERPFQGNRRLLLLQVLEDEPRAPRQLNDRIPRDLETICLKAMAKTPSRRYESAQDLSEDLQRHLNGDPIQARPVGHPERLFRWCRRYPLAAGLLLAVTLGSAVGFSHLSQLSRYFVQETALDSVRMEADMLERIYEYYSDEIVARLDREKVQVTHEYFLHDDAVPLPATLLIDAGERISANTSGMQVRLFSNYPWRKDGGPKDDFERRAIAVLGRRAREGATDLSLHEFDSEGTVVRYARGQIMKESCVQCHKQDASPKRDWEKGDLAGVLAITRPLDRDIERTRSGLSGAFVLVGTIGVLMLGLSLGTVLISRLRERFKPNSIGS